MELSIKVDSQTSEAELDFAIDTLKKFKKVQAEVSVTRQDILISDMSADDIERFTEKYEELGEDECWNWKGSSCKKYGRFVLYPGDGVRVPTRAHRVAFFLANGRLPEGGLVCHRCDNTSCVNPSHLFEGTVKDNNEDKVKKGRGNWARGENAGGAKLSDIEVEEIRKRLANGEKQKDIAKDYGVYQSAISKIHLGQRRAKVDPKIGSSSGLSPVEQFKAGYKAPEQAPLDFDTIKPVPETTLENGFTYSAPAASPAPVQKSSEFSPASPPPMFSPENMKALAERQAMNSGVKAAPIVSAVEMFDANAPVFIPAPMRTVEPKFTVPAATEEVKKDTESFKNQAWHEAHARANDGMSFKRLLAQAAKDAAEKGAALGR